MITSRPSTKVLLVVDPREHSAEHDAGGIRRYRLARLRFESRDRAPGARFEHLKRVYE